MFTSRDSLGPGETFPIVFGMGNDLFGLLTTPARSRRRPNMGIVVCAPIGLENIFSYRPLRTLGLHLANLGFPVFRFDWLGSGDSGELPERVTGPDLWRNAVRDAIGSLVAATGVDEVTIVGLRIGATFGLLEAMENPLVTQVALLKPHSTGRAYLSELRAFEKIAGQPISTHRDPVPLPEGAMESGGFLLSAGEVEALRSIDLTDAEAWSHAPRRSLIVSTRAERATSELEQLLVERGSTVENRVDVNLSNLWALSILSYLPATCKQLVASWLMGDERPRRRALRGRVAASGHGATLRLAEGRVVERATSIQTGRGRLLAVTCVPGRVDRSRGDWAVLLNAGPVRRIGPNRFYVSWARRWAEANLPSLRLDVHGVGDSDGDPERDESLVENPLLLHEPGRLLDVEDALDWLADVHGARRFAMIGLCAGGTHAFRTGLSDPRVAAVALLNPGSLIVDARIRELVAWDLAHLEAERLRTSSAQLRGNGIPELIERSEDEFADPGARSAAWRSYGPVLRASLAEMKASNTRTAVLFSQGDEGIGLLERVLGPDFPAVLGSYGVELETIDGPDHTFRPLWSHGVVYDFLRRVLVSTGFLEDA